MFLDPTINWSSIYRRNNKTKNKKHLLCFPDHTDGKHKENGFCGQSINVYINASEIKSPAFLVYGRFSLIGVQSDAHSVGDVVPIDSINTDMLSESPYYLAVEKGNLVDKIVFTINPRLKGWNYGRPLTHTEFLYSFYVYLFEKFDDNNLICRDRVTSPPFRLCTSRRCSTTTPTPTPTTPSSITTTITNRLSNNLSSILSPIHSLKSSLSSSSKKLNNKYNNNKDIPKSPMKISTNNNNNITPLMMNDIVLDEKSSDVMEYTNNELPISSYPDINETSKVQDIEIPPPPIEPLSPTLPPPLQISIKNESYTTPLQYTPIQNNNNNNNNIFNYDVDYMDMGSLSDVINSFPPLSPCNSQTHLNSKTVTKNEPESPKPTQVMELKGKRETMENLPGINSTTSFVKEEDGTAKEYFRFIQNIPISDYRRTEIAPNGDDIERYLEYDITHPRYQLDRCGRIIPIEHLINYVFEDKQ